MAAGGNDIGTPDVARGKRGMLANVPWWFQQDESMLIGVS